MVFCCVPGCSTDSSRCDPSITFHEIPTDPTVAKKWIQQVSAAIGSVWNPIGTEIFCSKHFLQTDFKDNTDALKPFSVPTIFGHKYIGENATVKEAPQPKDSTSSPMIVKVATPRPQIILKNVSPLSASRSQTLALLGNPIASPAGAVSTAVRFVSPSSGVAPNTAVQFVGPTSSPVRTRVLSVRGPTPASVPSSPGRPNTAIRSVSLKPIRPKAPSSVSPVTFPVLSQPVKDATAAVVHPPNTDISPTMPVPISPVKSQSVRKVSQVSAGSAQLSVPEIRIDNVQSLSPLHNSKTYSNSENGDASDSVQSLPVPNVTMCDSGGEQYKVQTIFQRPIKTEPSSSTVTPENRPRPAVKRKGENPAKTLIRKKEKLNEDLIEIGPNTYLKINPDIIKVNKKLTPSGNTVLQFLMDSKVANGNTADLLPKVVQGPIENLTIQASNANQVEKNPETNNQPKASAVQHVVGHLVDTHECRDTCSDIEMLDESGNAVKSDITNSNSEAKEITKTDGGQNSLADSSFLEKAPVLLTTKLPISHCLGEKNKFLLQLKQRGRQIGSLKAKISTMQKKIDELEDRCIVQERQLSYSFIKKLKTIRKNATKGDPCATYILEQIRCYTDSQKMRWSDSTLAQCAIWCRKAPYAYEYFKKAEFFKLPCLATVKRFMKKHPDVAALKKIVPNPQVEDESSSDFEFGDSDTENKGMSEEENHGNTVPVEDSSSQERADERTSENLESDENRSSLPESSAVVDTNQSEGFKITLPNGEEIQCHGMGTPGQYIIIPNPGDQNAGEDCEYSLVPVDSLTQSMALNEDENSGTQLPESSNSSPGKEHINEEDSKSNDNESSQSLPEPATNASFEIMLPNGEAVQCQGLPNSDGQYFIIPTSGDQNSGDCEYSMVSVDSLPLVVQNLNSANQHEQLIVIGNAENQGDVTETVVSSS